MKNVKISLLYFLVIYAAYAHLNFKNVSSQCHQICLKKDVDFEEEKKCVIFTKFVALVPIL